MPEKIQRVPLGLQNLLNLNSGFSPGNLADALQLVLEALQFYGLNQRQVGTVQNAVAAEGTAVTVPLPTTSWSVLFACHGVIVKTATVTALRGEIFYNRGGLAVLHEAAELGPFGATETGSCSFGGLLPYPLLMPPGSSVTTIPRIIGTDANANVTCNAEFGVLG